MAAISSPTESKQLDRVDKDKVEKMTNTESKDVPTLESDKGIFTHRTKPWNDDEIEAAYREAYYQQLLHRESLRLEKLKLDGGNENYYPKITGKTKLGVKVCHYYPKGITDRSSDPKVGEEIKNVCC